jgi:hypothetical protein
LTTGGTGETPSTYRRRTMWRVSSIEVVIFIAVVIIAVALMLLA